MNDLVPVYRELYSISDLHMGGTLPGMQMFRHGKWLKARRLASREREEMALHVVNAREGRSRCWQSLRPMSRSTSTQNTAGSLGCAFLSLLYASLADRLFRFCSGAAHLVAGDSDICERQVATDVGVRQAGLCRHRRHGSTIQRSR